MKKATILFLFILLIGNASFVSAQIPNQKELNEIQETNPSVFIHIVTPEVAKAVKKEHGEQVKWKTEGITKISVHNDHTVKPLRRWYEVSMKVAIQEPNSNEKHTDLVISKIITKEDLMKMKQVEDVDAFVTVLEYEHNVK
ncbi:hypothetical protein [Heyndrickxia camelliae]|uniref:Uncharacterized protein n=1 Tax=Heyndrickxia camelliae TaxID=1707093 RepID=A0A2N3LPF3_9BACI|nr:hypothetical protein [Heyndrickxia camelliae]PKR86393.1 hypothetical protein CWO92_04670 [Heyndrickxia camelliae]